MSHRFLPVVAAAALLVVALGACSGSAATPPPANPPAAAASAAIGTTGSVAAPGSNAGSNAGGAAGSACGLVTVDEVVAAAGQPMAMSGDGGSICTFSAAADPSFVMYVQVYNDKPSMGMMMQVETGSDHLSGMGDDAFWNATLGTVFVERGSRGFSVALPSLANLSTTPAAEKANMVTLAQAALGRF
jgi:hypothetical protein